MQLYHCTEFAELQEIIRLRCLKVSDLEEFQELAVLGIRGAWLTSASYGNQYFGPYQFTFEAIDILCEKFIILKRSETRVIIFCSHSPTIVDLAKILNLEIIHADSENGPLKRENGVWSASSKVDIICDFPIPILKARRVDAGTSNWTRTGKVSNPLDRMSLRTSARLLSLFLHLGKDDLDELVAKNAQELSNNLFQALHGLNSTFDKNVITTRSTLSPVEMREIDVVSSATKCLVEGDFKGGMLLASIAGSAENLAEKIAVTVNRRFGITSVDVSQILAC